MAVGVDAQALVEEHLAIRALTAADKKDHVVLRGEAGNIRHAVGYGATDGVEALERGTFGDMRLDVVDDAMELIERLRGLGVEIDVARKVELHHLIEVLDNDCLRLGLTNKAKHLGMSLLTEDDDLCGRSVGRGVDKRAVVLRLDALLELEHHRTGGIDDLDVVLAGQFIGLRGFTMGTQQHLDMVKLAHVVVVDGDESHLTQALALHAVVHDIAETIEGLALCELFLGFLNGGGHSETEATAFINFNNH